MNEVQQRPMRELRRIVAEDAARFDELEEAWHNLLEPEKVEFASHDGDSDYVSLMAGIYNEYVGAQA